MGISIWIYVSILLFSPFYTPMKIHSIEIMNPGKVVFAGAPLIYKVNYTKKKAYPVIKVTRQLIDGFIITLPKVTGSSLPIGSHTKKVSVTVPPDAFGGTYYLHLSAIYQVNHLRTITVTTDSDKFEIRRP
jgi:hypothetical protein